MKPSTFLKSLLLTTCTLSSFSSGEQLDTSPYDIPASLSGYVMSDNTSASRYPTDITRNIVPKALHSHNDYWRDVPFWSAISVGAISIEADVWLKNNTLYVGHEESALTPSRTFDSLYISQIMTILRRTNPNSSFVSHLPTRNGLWDMSSTQTTYLWIDCKTEGSSTFAAAIKALQPLRDAGYLTTATNGTVSMGPVTVIGTGNTPLKSVQGVSPRDYFWDAPVDQLNTTFANITRDVSPIASADFASAVGALPNGTISASSLEKLKSQIAVAKSKGIGARYWDTPGWPISARNRVWEQLWDQGVALVNVDDVVAGAGYSDRGNWWSP